MTADQFDEGAQQAFKILIASINVTGQDIDPEDVNIISYGDGTTPNPRTSLRVPVGNNLLEIIYEIVVVLEGFDNVTVVAENFVTELEDAVASFGDGFTAEVYIAECIEQGSLTITENSTLSFVAAVITDAIVTEVDTAVPTAFPVVVPDTPTFAPTKKDKASSDDETALGKAFGLSHTGAALVVTTLVLVFVLLCAAACYVYYAYLQRKIGVGGGSEMNLRHQLPPFFGKAGVAPDE